MPDQPADAAPYDAGDAPTTTARPLPTHGDAHAWKTTAINLANQLATLTAERDQARADLQATLDRAHKVRIDAHGVIWHATPDGHWHHRIYGTRTLERVDEIFGTTRPALLVDIDTITALGSAPARAQDRHDWYPDHDGRCVTCHLPNGECGSSSAPARAQDPAPPAQTAPQPPTGSGGPSGKGDTGTEAHRGTQAVQPGRFCHRHFSWLCQAGQGQCQAAEAAPTRAQAPDDLTDRLADALATLIRSLNTGAHHAQTSRHTDWIPVTQITEWELLLAEHADRSTAAGWTAEADRLDQQARAHHLDVDDLLTNARLQLTDATNDDERAEAIEMLLNGWYAAWPDDALTDPTAPLAAELVRLLTARPDRAQGQAALRPADWERQAIDQAEDALRAAWIYLDNDPVHAEQLATTAVRALIDAGLVPPATPELPAADPATTEALRPTYRPATAADMHTPGYHWGRAWAPTQDETTCPCTTAPCGYIVAGTEHPDCPHHHPVNTTRRGGHPAAQCPGREG